MEVAANPPSPGDAPPPPAELVVVNGRLQGVRRPVAGPLTLIGRAPGCEVRLNVEGVEPLHAALVHGPDGFHLRDLAGGVLVNDKPPSETRLKHGDVIGVGPFGFRLEVACPSAEEVAESEREALRIQAAAVAAQQTALNEEEARLQQQRVALGEQEDQLAARLEERRQRLLEIQEQTRQERAAFQAARAAAELEQAAFRKELDAARGDAAAAGEQARGERRRLVELRKRLRRRWRRHWDAKEAELAARESRLGRETEKLGQARAALDEDRLRLNGEVELAKRQMQEQWQELGLAQQQWEACLNQEHAERTRRVREQDARAAALQEAERAWAGREQSLRLTVAELQREGEGLDARVRNRREQLTQEEEAVARLRAERGVEVPPPAVVLPPMVVEPAGDERAAVLERVAGSLADQRVHLLEQWQALLHVQEEWRRERQETLAGLEAVGRSLQEREQRVLAQERRLDAAAADCRRQQQSLSHMRLSLEGWQSRLRARDAAWDGERGALLAEVRAREEAAELQLRRLHDLARKRELERGREAQELAAARERGEDLRRQYVALWDECRRRRKELAREQRELAARTLAAEQLRLEIVGKAPDSARAERRLERLRRRNAVRLDAAEREITAARNSLAAEGARLDELARRLKQQQDELAARRGEWARERAAWEERRAAAEDAEDGRRLELQRLSASRQQNEHLIGQLRDEVERMASLLIEEAEAPAAQAA